MASNFLNRLCHLITTSEPFDPESLAYVRTAFEDTLAVAFAGWAEPVTRKVAQNYPGGSDMSPNDMSGVESEAAAMIYGTASHALDFDDVHQVSHSHPSAPIISGLVVAVQEEPALAPRMTTAFGIGLSCNIELGRVLGFAHYEKGWHATSTIGPVATAAALSYLYGFNAKSAAHALGLAAAQCGGLQRNFGSMAKPFHAGLAGAAGLRAARMARVGLTADEDIFGDKGYFDLYGGEKLDADPEKVEFDLFSGGISVKLYPCCYLNHRNIALAFDAREALLEKGIAPEGIGRIELEAPHGGYLALRVKHPPTVGTEAKFCGSYVAACALLDGRIGLGHFEDDVVGREDVARLFDRIVLKERERGVEDSFGGAVKMTVFDNESNPLISLQRKASPGAPDDAPSKAQIQEKVRDCLEYYSRNTGRDISYEQFQGFIDSLFALPANYGDQVQIPLGDD